MGVWGEPLTLIVSVGMWGEPTRAPDKIVIHHSQHAELRVRRVEVLGKGEVEPRFEPRDGFADVEGPAGDMSLQASWCVPTIDHDV